MEISQLSIKALPRLDWKDFYFHWNYFFLNDENYLFESNKSLFARLRLIKVKLLYTGSYNMFVTCH